MNIIIIIIIINIMVTSTWSRQQNQIIVIIIKQCQPHSEYQRNIIIFTQQVSSLDIYVMIITILPT